MAHTVGIHWIATTFGTWLHGDPRGSWRNGKLIGPDPFCEEAIRRRMTSDAVVLAEPEMILVAATFGESIVEKNWAVHAATVHPTHTHVVFAPLDDPIGMVIATLKSRSARRVLTLRRQMQCSVGRSLWTEGQFAVYIFDERHLHNAVEYVRRHNHRIGRPDDAYPWVKPVSGEMAVGNPAQGKPAQDGPAI